MKAGNILKLAAPNYVESHPAHLRNSIIDTLNVLMAAADTFNENLAAMQDDANLSPQGRTVASARVAAAALATLTAIETTTIKKLADHAAAIEASLVAKVSYTPPTDAADRIAHEMQLQEIRNQLRQLPLAERANVYRTTTDPLVLAAIDTAPPTLSASRADGSRRMEPFIDAAERTAAVLERAERVDPATVRTLKEVQSVREVYTLAVGGLRREILAAVPDAAPTPELSVV